MLDRITWDKFNTSLHASNLFCRGRGLYRNVRSLQRFGWTTSCWNKKLVRCCSEWRHQTWVDVTWWMTEYLSRSPWSCLHTVNSQRLTFTLTRNGSKKKRKSIYIAPFIYYVYLKALRHGSHSFTCKYTMRAFPS